jgi:hypothetical protein
MRYAKAMIEHLIERHSNPFEPEWSWGEGWRLGMEEALYRLEMDLHWLASQRSGEPGLPGEKDGCPGQEPPKGSTTIRVTDPATREHIA